MFKAHLSLSMNPSHLVQPLVESLVGDVNVSVEVGGDLGEDAGDDGPEQHDGIRVEDLVAKDI